MAMYSNLTVDQGSTFDTVVTISDNEGNPLNITGYTFAAQIKKNYASSTAVSFNIAALNPTEGTVNLNLTSAQTDAMKPGRYLYDFEMISGTGVVTRVLEGQMEITPSVTRL